MPKPPSATSSGPLVPDNVFSCDQLRAITGRLIARCLTAPRLIRPGRGCGARHILCLPGRERRALVSSRSASISFSKSAETESPVHEAKRSNASRSRSGPGTARPTWCAGAWAQPRDLIVSSTRSGQDRELVFVDRAALARATDAAADLVPAERLRHPAPLGHHQDDRLLRGELSPRGHTRQGAGSPRHRRPSGCRSAGYPGACRRDSACAHTFSTAIRLMSPPDTSCG